MDVAKYESYTHFGKSTCGDKPRRPNSGPFSLKALHAMVGATSTTCSESSSSDVNAIQFSVDRHLSLLDLVLVGIGGTIGSGLFVLCGLVAHEYAGPATAISWALSGFAACISGCCYAEMASQVPAAGSAYTYAYIAIGELFGVLAAACLSLEYMMAASAVARSWADKVALYLIEELPNGHWIHNYLQPDLGYASPLAFAMSTASLLLLLSGVHQTKATTNFLTIVKIVLVLYMILVGFSFVHTSNWTPFVPPQFGAGSVIRGSTATFFGYLGYDEVCQLAGEAKDPKRNLPIAIMITLAGVTLLYITAALSLTGMQSFENISSVSGFPVAFRANGSIVAARVAALGEVFTLPVVVVLTMIGQPRLQYALAKDGLLPSWFAKVDSNGNLFNGTLFCGIVCILLSTFVPFSRLNDLISAAVLTALNITDTSLVALWYDSPPETPFLTERFLGVFHFACFTACFVVTRYLNTAWGSAFFLIAALVAILSMIGIYRFCPKNELFGGNRRHKDAPTSEHGSFRTPFLPFWPCAGVFINWYLIAQLDLIGTMGMLGFLVVATAVYLLLGRYRKKHSGWDGTSAFPTECASLVRNGPSLSGTQSQLRVLMP